MNRSKSLAGVIFRVAVFTAAMATLLAVIVTSITRPVDGDTHSYRAVFTDVSGLKPGDDVRMFGLRVGKVETLDYDNGKAAVEFTVQDQNPIFTESVFAIRFQSLTGQRYIDIRQPGRAGEPLAKGATIGIDHTVGSFDLTSLFNGLRPVLVEFSPETLNHFTQNVLAVIEGDGSAIGPTLASIEKISTYATDRQAVISTLIANLKTISDQVGGNSPHLVTLLRGISDVFAALEVKVDGLIEFADNAPQILGPINSLLATFGLTYPANPNLEEDLRLLFPDPDAAIESLNRLPGLLQSLNSAIPQTGTTTSYSCSKGQAAVPFALAILVRGQQVSICNG